MNTWVAGQSSCLGHIVSGVALIFALIASDAAAATIRVTAQTGSDIQAAINSLPSEGGTVIVRSRKGGIKVMKSIVINRNNVTLEGEGKGSTVLKLGSGANVPVIVIGQTNAVPTIIRRNIHIRNLAIDGNRSNQSTELDPGNDALRNNGISLRHVAECTVDQVRIRSCRSGGLVTELGCQRLTISNVDSADNHFDGIAGYQTEASIYNNLYLHDNLAAGFSFDIDFNRNIFSNCMLADNGDVGMFMRDSRDNVFAQLQVRNSAKHGIFLAQVDADSNAPAAGNTFTGCSIGDNGWAGIRVNNDSCSNNMVAGSQFFGNGGGNVSESSVGLLKMDASISR